MKALALIAVSAFVLFLCIGPVCASTSFSSSSGSSASSGWDDPTPRIFIDVGNDTDDEWEIRRSFTGPQIIDVTSVNRYVRGGCWCDGCVLDAGSSENCTVPIVFRAHYPGKFTVNDVKISFAKFRIVNQTGYGNSFREQGDGCWGVTDPSGLYGSLFPVPKDRPGLCAASTETYPPAAVPYTTDGALNDAMYRLLNNSLDLDNSGAIDIALNDNMSFETEGQIGVQTLWGPVQMRLVVWS
jgi:hypothetical protein